MIYYQYLAAHLLLQFSLSVYQCEVCSSGNFQVYPMSVIAESDVRHMLTWPSAVLQSQSLSLPSDSTPLNNWLEIGPQRQSRLYSAAREQLLVVEMVLFGWCHCGGGGCRPRPWWWWWCGKTAVTTSCSLHFSRLLNSPVSSLHTPRVAQTPFWLTWSPHRAPPPPSHWSPGPDNHHLSLSIRATAILHSQLVQGRASQSVTSVRVRSQSGGLSCVLCAATEKICRTRPALVLSTTT